MSNSTPSRTRNTSTGPGGPPLGRIGTLEVRLAASPADVRTAQALRFQVFMGEMAVVPGLLSMVLRRDHDRWDKFCDHLLVVETDGGKERIVGTYRLLRQEIALKAKTPFYTEREFDLAGLLANHPHRNFLELGRSCVLPQWRNKRTVELLWHGIWSYVLQHKVDVLFGCASFSGTDPDALAAPLSFLHDHAAADPQWVAVAKGKDAVALGGFAGQAADERVALRAMPPLIKGYLRLGAMFGPQAFIDRRFSAIDVLVVLPVERISPRYVAHYGADAARFSARG